MKILHHLKLEKSGLFFTALEIAKYEERLGHEVCLMEPNGHVLHGNPDGKIDIHLIHSQIDPKYYHDGIVKILFAHGEPLSSVSNGISYKAIIDLASICDAIICFRKEEQVIWNTIKRTWYITKGVDLEAFRPLDDPGEKLSGAPSIVYLESWRGIRNPLYLVVAALEVWKKYPDTRLHLFNCTDKRMYETFQAYVKHSKLWPYLRTISGPVEDVNLLLNRCDIAVSCLGELFARTPLEAIASGRPGLCPGYRSENNSVSYPFVCRLEPMSMASSICAAYEAYKNKTFDFREYATRFHSAEIMVRECLEVYKRYLSN